MRHLDTTPHHQLPAGGPGPGSGRRWPALRRAPVLLGLQIFGWFAQLWRIAGNCGDRRQQTSRGSSPRPRYSRSILPNVWLAPPLRRVLFAVVLAPARWVRRPDSRPYSLALAWAIVVGAATATFRFHPLTPLIGLRPDPGRRRPLGLHPVDWLPFAALRSSIGVSSTTTTGGGPGHGLLLALLPPLLPRWPSSPGWLMLETSSVSARTARPGLLAQLAEVAQPEAVREAAPRPGQTDPAGRTAGAGSGRPAHL